MKAHNYYGFDGWHGEYSSVLNKFEAQDENKEEPKYVYAVYSTPAYEGSADVFFYRDGQWFHNSGGHCSCYGLENQWEPEAIDLSLHVAALSEGRRIYHCSDTENDYPEATLEAFDQWCAWAIEDAKAAPPSRTLGGEG